jgi:predicted O-methyltransferase YrrM
MSNQSTHYAFNDKKIETVLENLYKDSNTQLPQLILHYLPKLPAIFLGKGIKWNQHKTDFYKDKYIPIEKDQGNLIYLLARAINAKTIVEFGTSFGISTIYLGAAVRDNGAGKVIGTELVAQKVIQARKNITEAGLENYIEIREGDALETLKNLNQTVDMLLIDGWVNLALDVLKLVDPFIRQGGIVISDNVGTFKDDLKPYVEYLQNPDNGYQSSTLSLKAGTELSVKVR